MKQLIKIFAVVVLITSCRSVNKNKTENHKKNDSTSFSASNSSQYIASDSATSKENNNNASNFNYSDSTGELNIYFSEKDYSSGDSSQDKNSDTNAASIGKPGAIQIANDGKGNITIDPGGRTIKAIKQKSTNTKLQLQQSNKDSSSTTKVSTTNKTEAKKSDSTRVVSTEDNSNMNKKTSSFNWLLLCIVVALLATGIYIIRNKIHFFTKEDV
jgi:hypothetical protein